MKYSDKLNGFWEEGYHYYLEFRDDKLTVRNYRRSICLTTEITYDAQCLEIGERTVITLADNVLSRAYDGEMMTEIKELAYENGQLFLLYYYTIMGETLYTLHKADKGPFDHIIIRDDEYLESLQGTWEQWSSSGKGMPITIKGNKLYAMGIDGRAFHIVSYNYSPQNVYIVPENLIDSDFGSYTKIEVHPDMLTATMIVMDMSMPLIVFARANMLDKIEIPEAAKIPPRNTMMYNPAPMVMTDDIRSQMKSFMGMKMGMQIGMTAEQVEKEDNESTAEDSAVPAFCPNCGYKLGDIPIKFCPECGYSIKSK